MPVGVIPPRGVPPRGVPDAASGRDRRDAAFDARRAGVTSHGGFFAGEPLIGVTLPDPPPPPPPPRAPPLFSAALLASKATFFPLPAPHPSNRISPPRMPRLRGRAAAGGGLFEGGCRRENDAPRDAFRRAEPPPSSSRSIPRLSDSRGCTRRGPFTLPLDWSTAHSRVSCPLMSLWTTVTPEVPPSIATTTACPWVRDYQTCAAVHDLSTRLVQYTYCTRTVQCRYLFSKVYFRKYSTVQRTCTTTVVLLCTKVPSYESTFESMIRKYESTFVVHVLQRTVGLQYFRQMKCFRATRTRTVVVLVHVHVALRVQLYTVQLSYTNPHEDRP